jgi:hypothetical protein
LCQIYGDKKQEPLPESCQARAITSLASSQGTAASSGVEEMSAMSQLLRTSGDSFNFCRTT